jgi:hypothetical protein
MLGRASVNGTRRVSLAIPYLASASANERCPCRVALSQPWPPARIAFARRQYAAFGPSRPSAAGYAPGPQRVYASGDRTWFAFLPRRNSEVSTVALVPSEGQGLLALKPPSGAPTGVPKRPTQGVKRHVSGLQRLPSVADRTDMQGVGNFVSVGRPS